MEKISKNVDQQGITVPQYVALASPASDLMASGATILSGTAGGDSAIAQLVNRRDDLAQSGPPPLTLWFLYPFFGKGLSPKDFSLYRAPRLETKIRLWVYVGVVLLNMWVLQLPFVLVLSVTHVFIFVAFHHLPGRPKGVPKENIGGELWGALLLSLPLLATAGFLDFSAGMEGVSTLVQALTVAGSVLFFTRVEEPLHRILNRRAWKEAPHQMPEMGSIFPSQRAVAGLINDDRALPTETRERLIQLVSPPLGVMTMDRVNGLFVLEQGPQALQQTLQSLLVDLNLKTGELLSVLQENPENQEAVAVLFRTALAVARNAVASQWEAVRMADASVSAREVEGRIFRLAFLMGRAQALGARVEWETVVPLLFALQSVRSREDDFTHFSAHFFREVKRGGKSLAPTLKGVEETLWGTQRMDLAGITEGEGLFLNLVELEGEGGDARAARNVALDRVRLLLKEGGATAGPLVFTDTFSADQDTLLEKLTHLLNPTLGSPEFTVERVSQLVRGNKIFLVPSPGIVRPGVVYRRVRDARGTDVQLTAVVLNPNLWSLELNAFVRYVTLLMGGKPIPLMPTLDLEYRADHVRGAAA